MKKEKKVIERTLLHCIQQLRFHILGMELAGDNFIYIEHKSKADVYCEIYKLLLKEISL